MEGVRAEALGQSKLAFDDLVNQSMPARTRRALKKRLKPSMDQHGFLSSDDLVRQYCSGRAVRIWTGLSRAVIELVIHAHAAQSAWVASKPSRVITLGLAVALESLTQRRPWLR